MTADKKSLKGVKGIFKKIWHNLFKEYYRQKALLKAKKDIAESGQFLRRGR